MFRRKKRGQRLCLAGSKLAQHFMRNPAHTLTHTCENGTSLVELTKLSQVIHTCENETK